MSKKPQAEKVSDRKDPIRMKSGAKGERREEVWVAGGEVVSFNFALVVPSAQWKDNGRILGYDNAHGYAERHYRGTAEAITATFEECVERFNAEIVDLKEEL